MEEIFVPYYRIIIWKNFRDLIIDNAVGGT